MNKRSIVTFLFFLVMLMGFVPVASGQVAVISHKSTPVDSVSKSNLLDFYSHDIRKWNDGTAVIVKDLKEKGEVRSLFYDFLGKSASRMKSIWLKKMLSGEGDPPEAVANEEEMLKKVAATPGAIGFVSREKVNDQVKTLLIISSSEDKSP